jgi:hypothetical protein
MVAAKDGDAGRVTDFERDEESDGFDRIIASVNVVTFDTTALVAGSGCERGYTERILTHEEIVGIWIRPTNAEELHQIVKLAMNVTANGHRAFLGVSQSRQAMQQAS